MLVAQDLAVVRAGPQLDGRRPALSMAAGRRAGIVPLVEAVAARVPRVRLLYLYPSDLTDELVARHPGHRCALLRPLAAARRQAAAAPDAPLGRRRPLPRPHRGHPAPRRPTRRSARTSSSATRARPRPTTTSCWPSWPRPSSTGAASSPTPRRRAPTPPGLDGKVPQALDGRAPGRAARAAGRHHRGHAATGLIGTHARGARRRAGRGAQPPGSPRDRRHRAGARAPGARARSPRVEVIDALGPDSWPWRRRAASVPGGVASGRRGAMSISERRNNPDALATWANAVTVGPGARGADPVRHDHQPQGPVRGLVVGADRCGSPSSATDLIDGFLARRHGTTTSGAFLDPLADKVLVLGAMFALVGKGVFPLLPVADHRRAGDRRLRVPHAWWRARASACRPCRWPR